MKFIFSLRTRQADERYAMVRSWTLDKEGQLYAALLSASLYESFYDQPAAELAELRKMLRYSDPLFISRMAVHFREQLGFRDLSFILAAELSAISGDRELVAGLTARVIQHAGEIPHWLDHYERVHDSHGRHLRVSGAMRKHLAVHFNRLDTYRFVRLTRVQQARLRHALSVVRPKAEGKVQQTLFRRIRQDKLPARNAWQSEYEALRLQHFDSREIRQTVLKDKWKEGISTFRIGYGALLNNLPELLSAGVSGKVLKLAAEYLGNAAAVAGSKQSPLRLVEAYRELQQVQQGGAVTLREALELAVLHSAREISAREVTGSDEHENVVIAMDISPSMRQPVREGSLVKRFDIAPLIAMLLKSRGVNVTAGVIGNTWKHIALPVYPVLGELDLLNRRAGEVGYAIHGHLVILDLLRKREIVDKVMIFTDCQLWDQRAFNQLEDADLGRIWKQYRQLAPDAKLYLFDLAGYGKPRMERLEDGVYRLAGWSDRVFKVLEALEVI